MTGRWKNRSATLGRDGKRLLAAALMSVVLTACGGGGGGGEASAAGASTPPTAFGGAGAPAAGAAPPAAHGGTQPTPSTPAPSTPAPSTPAPSTPPPSAPVPAGGSGGLEVATPAADGSVTLSWNAPTMNDDGTPANLTGYRIYWGLLQDNPTHSVTVKNPGLSRYVVEPLTPALWYFFVTALSEYGESPPSNVIAMQVP
jgi:hypothetical protein